MTSITQSATRPDERKLQNLTQYGLCVDKFAKGGITICPLDVQIAGLRGNQVLPSVRCVYFDQANIDHPDLTITFLFSYVKNSMVSKHEDKDPKWIITDFVGYYPVEVLTSSLHTPRLIVSKYHRKITTADRDLLWSFTNCNMREMLEHI